MNIYMWMYHAFNMHGLTCTCISKTTFERICFTSCEVHSESTCKNNHIWNTWASRFTSITCFWDFTYVNHVWVTPLIYIQKKSWNSRIVSQASFLPVHNKIRPSICYEVSIACEFKTWVRVSKVVETHFWQFLKFMQILDATFNVPLF